MEKSEIDGLDEPIIKQMPRRPVLKTIGAVSAVGAFSDLARGAEGESPETDNSFDLIETTIAEIQAAIAAGDITSRAITEQYIDRIHAYDNQLNAIIRVNENALQRAKELDEAFADSGPVGPLHGIPILLKDNIDSGSIPTTGGNILFEDTIPLNDAFLTEQLEDAGGVILAKANLGEFAYGSVSSLGGQAYNPYDLDRSPGGSSSGPGAGTAANLGAISVGTDTGGSIRSPANNCSLVGFRPTTGLISRDGIIPLTETLDTAGPMTRTVTDNAIMLDVLAGYDPADPETADAFGEIPEEGYASYLNPDGLDGARIGVSQQLMEFDEDEEAIANVIDSALSAMENNGATIVNIDDISTDLTDLAEEGDVISYEIKGLFNEYLDSLGEEAPVETFTELVESETVEGVIKDITFPDAVDVNPDTLNKNIDYLQSLLVRRDLRAALYTAIADHDLDAFAYPAGPYWLSPVASFPSVMVPAGFTGDTEYPVGIEFMAEAFQEPRLIELAYSFEQATMARHPQKDLASFHRMRKDDGIAKVERGTDKEVVVYGSSAAHLRPSLSGTDTILSYDILTGISSVYCTTVNRPVLMTSGFLLSIWRCVENFEKYRTTAR